MLDLRFENTVYATIFMYYPSLEDAQLVFYYASGKATQK
jgi:hypothetical protein